MRAACWVALWLPVVALGCKCVGGEGSACNPMNAEAVFIGIVESIDPPVNPWDPAVSARLEKQIPEALLQQKTAANLTRLKRIYVQALPDLPARFKRELEQVNTWPEFDAFWDRVMEEGVRARFRVLESFRGPGAASLDVWTSLSDCGVPFQRGETYVVYASGAKSKGGRLETGVCERTSRLTDAGGDLPFLYLLKRGGNAASRLIGTVTKPSAEGVPKPLGGVMVHLTNAGVSRWSMTDNRGQFVVDGLEAGDYKVAVLEDPSAEQPAAPPFTLAIKANACSAQLFAIPPAPPK